GSVSGHAEPRERYLLSPPPATGRAAHDPSGRSAKGPGARGRGAEPVPVASRSENRSDPPPLPWGLPSRAGPPHGQGLHHHRLRGRVGQAPRRPTAQVLPLRDVAGMLRSFHYAAYAALLGQVPGARPNDFSTLEPWARFWYRAVSAAFLKGYLPAVASASLLPQAAAQLGILLDAYRLAKSI